VVVSSSDQRIGAWKIHTIAGLDSLQALSLAMHFARGYLPDEAQRHNGKIYWLTEDLDTIFDQRDRTIHKDCSSLLHRSDRYRRSLCR